MRGGVVEAGLDADLCGAVGGKGREDVEGVESYRGQIGQMYVAVEAAVEAEIAEFGRDPVDVG